MLEMIRDGHVLARPGIEHVEGHTVHFVDGSKEEVDDIICATGMMPCVCCLTAESCKFPKCLATTMLAGSRYGHMLCC